MLLLVLLTACRGHEFLLDPEVEKHGEPIPSFSHGFYLLNEGMMNSNQATLDCYRYDSATYTRNIYSAANPGITQSLGDVGNDLKAYGNRLYAVINCSNQVEVMELSTARHIGTIRCGNCRYLCFHDGYGYLTSYAGPVSMEHTQRGYVLKFDTATLQVIDTCLVGYQPDELAIVGDTLYVANSGGYMAPNYERDLSVIDLRTFSHVRRLPVAINLHRVRPDGHGGLWVTSRGDYMSVGSRLYYVDAALGRVTDSVDIAVSNLCVTGDSLYLCASDFDYHTMQYAIHYAIVDNRTHQLLTRAFITDGTTLQMPYGIAVHPLTHDIYLTDAKDYVSPGTLYCFGIDGKQKWSVRAGDIPAHIAFF